MDKLMINIVCKGFANIPDEAKHCPVCGQYREFYHLENLQYADPRDARVQCNIVDFAQKYPTFLCDNCKTIWQYLGEEEKE